MTTLQIPRLTKRELENLLVTWDLIARSTLDCSICDTYYETPIQWMNEKERRGFVDHLYEAHVKKREEEGKEKDKKKKG